MTNRDPAPSVLAGHWTDTEARTGCTVFLFDRLVPAAVDVRGGAPGTRETDLLAPGRLVNSVDAILFSGGSAFGLSAADGVVRFLRERGRGQPTPAGNVPIVPAAVIFDLSYGKPSWPDAAAGYEAASNARPLTQLERGAVGAGAGATVAKLWKPDRLRPAGLGLGRIRVDTTEVLAVAVVNAAGEVATTDSVPAFDDREALIAGLAVPEGRSSTTLVAVIVNGPVDRDTLWRCTVSGHCGLARMIIPSHTVIDGDVVFAVGLREDSLSIGDSMRVAIAAELAVEAAIRDAVINRTST